MIVTGVAQVGQSPKSEEFCTSDKLLFFPEYLSKYSKARKNVRLKLANSIESIPNDPYDRHTLLRNLGFAIVMGRVFRLSTLGIECRFLHIL